jgi:predicted lipid carrier protein YhbT
MSFRMMLTLPSMITNKSAPSVQPLDNAGVNGIARLLPPLPLFVLQPLLGHIVKTVALRHPELIARLGDNCKKRFLIDPNNLPFFLLLQPDPDRPRLKAHSRGQDIEHDVHISGTLTTLLRMIDGQSDSDAMFFNRDLSITGDTEAVVALRNALDNLDATLADDVAACFGPLSRPVRAVIDLTLKFASPKP